MHPPRGSIEPGLLVKDLVLGDPVYFKKDSRPNFILVDCDASRKLSTATPQLVYIHMDLEEARYLREGYSFLSLWPHPALDFRQDQTLGASTPSEKRNTVRDPDATTPTNAVSVDATTLWLAYKATITKTKGEFVEEPFREQPDTRLLVELPFAQDPSSYTARDLDHLRGVCNNAGRYYVFPNPPNASSTPRSGEYPAFLASLWHFTQMCFARTGAVYAVDRLDRDADYGEYWISSSSSSYSNYYRGEAERYTHKVGSVPPYDCEVTPSLLTDMPEFALIPFSGLLRAALEGMWILDPHRHTKYVFRRPDQTRSLGYGIRGQESRRYHNALLRTLLVATTCRTLTDFRDLRLALDPLREQAITLGIQLRPCLQPVVDPALLLSVALGMSRRNPPPTPHPHARTANYAFYLLLRHLDNDLPKPYWFGLLSTQRPHPTVPTFMTHREDATVPKAFPQGLGYDIPPMPHGRGLGVYFELQLDVRIREKEIGFIAPVFPVPDSASTYKLSLVRAQTEGFHVIDARTGIDIANIPESVLKDGCRLLLLGEWRTEKDRALPRSEQPETSGSEFMPLRLLLIRRCTCIAEPKPRWQQVAVLSLPHGWWEREAKGAELGGFRMAQPGNSVKEHRCPWDLLPAVPSLGRFVECLAEDKVKVEGASRSSRSSASSEHLPSKWSDTESFLVERQRKIEEREREAHWQELARAETREPERKTRLWPFRVRLL